MILELAFDLKHCQPYMLLLLIHLCNANKKLLLFCPQNQPTKGPFLCLGTRVASLLSVQITPLNAKVLRALSISVKISTTSQAKKKTQQPTIQLTALLCKMPNRWRSSLENLKYPADDAPVSYMSKKLIVP